MIWSLDLPKPFCYYHAAWNWNLFLAGNRDIKHISLCHSYNYYFISKSSCSVWMCLPYQTLCEKCIVERSDGKWTLSYFLFFFLEFCRPVKSPPLFVIYLVTKSDGLTCWRNSLSLRVKKKSNDDKFLLTRFLYFCLFYPTLVSSSWNVGHMCHSASSFHFWRDFFSNLKLVPVHVLCCCIDE